MIPSRYIESEAVGRRLFLADGTWPKEEFGFNSGVIGFRNMEVAREAFMLIETAIRRMSFVGLSYSWIDQPVANYVLAKLSMVDADTISDLIDVGTQDGSYSYAGSSGEAILIHFWSTWPSMRREVLQRYLQVREVA